MIIENQKELEILREGGKKLAAVLNEAASNAKEGVTTRELNNLAENLILKSGGTPSFKGYKVRGVPIPYPGSLCVSINDEVVHGLPSDRALKNGDIVGLDIGMLWPASSAGGEGLYTDTALTVLVGGGTNKLINATKKSLEIGIAQVRAGARVGDIGHAIQSFLEREEFGVVRELVGHGVGRAVHEDPEIPNFGKKGIGAELVEGMIIALEPMATEGSPKVKIAKDGWTWVTKDSSRSAHFEHTVVVTKNGAEILTQT
ncbi:MAG: Methionine aminopeptidase [Candidatus Giovannonibacteria bacterium GW2011_GWC2_44_9]|uniref:Methionine aminopeptidase n=3 Tax=Candidatus Giovannoniibacteriota TaxID=1752738 RepID=A0A0G1IXB4_9BACT|nr:MAG: Methionine aminopeptidase [Candidatus Giovannonibacteria bacterium GW2011_GWB1_44_23]KKT64041.1 MAG: Methionine aminopeptidase [Candidatus Giovannonibacteria bacterium GW2011_GWA1_44_29]KKT83908.1 MAG: Methionine aminopeptidase [Candidatus Giovannonibacteria bacterium GW2011_GWC2_44_9]KKT91889.1 MAG: Methionine aminopeptidase [Parcubacteria group bacterium GW2011_GWC1_45_13]